MNYNIVIEVTPVLPVFHEGMQRVNDKPLETLPRTSVGKARQCTVRSFRIAKNRLDEYNLWCRIAHSNKERMIFILLATPSNDNPDKPYIEA